MIPYKMWFAGIRDYDNTVMDLSGRQEHILITGPNGAGKSTITYCMGAVLYSSKVELEGLKSRNLLPDHTWNAQIRLLFRNEGSMKIDAPEWIEFAIYISQEPDQGSLSRGSMLYILGIALESGYTKLDIAQEIGNIILRHIREIWSTNTKLTLIYSI